MEKCKQLFSFLLINLINLSLNRQVIVFCFLVAVIQAQFAYLFFLILLLLVVLILGNSNCYYNSLWKKTLSWFENFTHLIRIELMNNNEMSKMSFRRPKFILFFCKSFFFDENNFATTLVQFFPKESQGSESHCILIWHWNSFSIVIPLIICLLIEISIKIKKKGKN